MALRTSIIIDLAGNMASRCNQLLGGLQRLGTGGSRAMNVLHNSISAAGRGLDRLGNRYTMLLSGAAGIGAIKQVGDLSMRLTRLGITADVSRAKIDALYGTILNVAQMKDVRVDPGEILSAVEKIVQKLGDLDFATKHTRTIGLAIQATGAAGEDVGDLLANFKEKFKLKDEEMLPALDILVKQGKAGAFELKDLVTQGNRVTAAYGAMGRSGMDAVREMGAMMQVFKKSTGMPEETATAFKNVFNDLMEPTKQKHLKALGINIWDPEKLKEGKKQIRSIVDIMDEILKKTKGDPEKLSRIFGMQSLDGIKAFLSEYQATGKNAATQFMGVTGDGSTLMRDAAKAAAEFNAAMVNLRTSWQRFAGANLAKPIQKLADVLNSLKPETVNLWMKVIAGGALVTGGAVLAKKGWDIMQWGKGLFKKGGAPGGLPGGGVMGATPVYVVNMPGSLPGSLPGKIPGAAKLAALAPVIGQVGAVIAATVATTTAVSSLVDALRGGSGDNWINKTVSGGEQLEVFKGKWGDMLYDMLHKQEKIKQKPAEVGGKIQIEIKQDGRAVVNNIQSNNPGVKMDVSTGLIMLGGR
jgi:TP901 family phage tail tape measure protein